MENVLLLSARVLRKKMAVLLGKLGLFGTPTGDDPPDEELGEGDYCE